MATDQEYADAAVTASRHSQAKKLSPFDAWVEVTKEMELEDPCKICPPSTFLWLHEDSKVTGITGNESWIWGKKHNRRREMGTPVKQSIDFAKEAFNKLTTDRDFAKQIEKNPAGAVQLLKNTIPPTSRDDNSKSHIIAALWLNNRFKKQQSLGT
jgi:hypothetical protein